MAEDDNQTPIDYQAVLRQSMEESRQARLAAPPLPNAAGYNSKPGRIPDEGVLLGAKGDGSGIARLNTPPRQPAQGTPPKKLSPLPYEVVDPSVPSAASVTVQVYKNSFFRGDPLAKTSIAVDGLGEDFAIVAGDHIWLQVDTDDGQKVSAVSVEHGQPPYVDDPGDGSGGQHDLVIHAGSGTDDDPYVWDQAFLPLARVYSSNGTTPHGGKLFSVGEIKLEVVQFVFNHLSARPTIVDTVWYRYPFPDARGYDT